MKQRGEKIVMATAYDYFSGCLVHGVGQKSPPPVHVTLVGDSLGMVMLGHADTRQVSVDHIALHCASVASAGRHPAATCRPFIVADMPFGSYTSPSSAVDNAVRLMREGGAGGVKLEGAGAHLPKVAAIVGEGIPVMGHLGLLPQVAASHSGMRLHCRSSSDASRLLEDAAALVEAGASSLVLEMVPRELGELVAASVPIPVIGIGAGAGTDGQVLVLHDLTGMNPNPTPGFTRRFADAGATLHEGVAAYARAVTDGSFPSRAHSHRMAPKALANLATALGSDGGEAAQVAARLAGSALQAQSSGADIWRRTAVPPPGPGLRREEVAIPLQEGPTASGARPVAVVGGGAMGRMVAAHLSLGGAHVTLCPGRTDSDSVQSPLHASLLQSTEGGCSTPGSLAVGSVGVGAPPDLILLAVKAGGVQAVLRRAEPWMAQGTAPVILANGVSHLHLLPPGGAAVVTSHGAYTTPLPEGATGVVQAGHGTWAMGLVHDAPPHPALHRLGAILHGVGVCDQPTLHSAIGAAAVAKLAVNCALNPTSILLDTPNGALSTLPPAGKALLDAAVKEALAAAAAAGLPVPQCPHTFQGVGGWDIVSATAGNISSSLADVRGGRETELGTLNGWVVDVLGPAAPANAQLLAAAALMPSLR